MNGMAPDILAVAERAVTEGAALDFQRRVEVVAWALQAERDRCADAIKALSKAVRRGVPT